MNALAALPQADLCPICDHNHEALDQFWACPKHGHKLQFDGMKGDLERFACPVQGCHYERTAPKKPRTPSKGDPMTAVATRPSTAVDAMWARKPHLDAVLPRHVEVNGFIGTAAAALYSNADLMRAAEVSPESLITALMRCAGLGHRPGTEEFYLVPRKIKGKPTIQGIEGYRGIVERMYRSGAVASVVVREVCANDKFRYVEGQDDRPVHSIGGEGATGGDFFGAIGSRDRGLMVGVYAYAILTTGAVSRVVLLSRDDVMAARAASDGADSPYSPWNRLDAGKDHPEFMGRSMWWKTAARRLEPWVPTSAEYRREQLRAAAQAAPAAAPPAWLPAPSEINDVHDAEIVDSPEPEVRAEPRATSGQHNIIRSLFSGMGFEEHENGEVLNITARLAGLPELDDLGQLTQDLAGTVITHLKSCKGSRPALMDLIANGEVPGDAA